MYIFLNSTIFSGPLRSLYFNVLALSYSYHLNGIEHSSLKFFLYTAKLVMFAQSEVVALALSIPSCHYSITNRLIKRSPIRRKRWRVSIMTVCRGIIGKSGMFEQLYLCLPLSRFWWDISSIVLAPFVISVIHQTHIVTFIWRALAPNTWIVCIGSINVTCYSQELSVSPQKENNGKCVTINI